MPKSRRTSFSRFSSRHLEDIIQQEITLAAYARNEGFSDSAHSTEFKTPTEIAVENFNAKMLGMRMSPKIPAITDCTLGS